MVRRWTVRTHPAAYAAPCAPAAPAGCSRTPAPASAATQQNRARLPLAALTARRCCRFLLNSVARSATYLRRPRPRGNRGVERRHVSRRSLDPSAPSQAQGGGALRPRGSPAPDSSCGTGSLCLGGRSASARVPATRGHTLRASATPSSRNAHPRRSARVCRCIRRATAPRAEAPHRPRTGPSTPLPSLPPSVNLYPACGCSPQAASATHVRAPRLNTSTRSACFSRTRARRHVKFCWMRAGCGRGAGAGAGAGRARQPCNPAARPPHYPTAERCAIGPIDTLSMRPSVNTWPPSAP